MVRATINKTFINIPPLPFKYIGEVEKFKPNSRLLHHQGISWRRPWIPSGIQTMAGSIPFTGYAARLYGSILLATWYENVESMDKDTLTKLRESPMQFHMNR
jgi:hypothetical protein